MSSHRPHRLRKTDFLGKLCTLPQGAASYERLDNHPAPKAHIVLGTAGLWGEVELKNALPHAAMLDKKIPVYMVEEPHFLSSLSLEDKELLPIFPDYWQNATNTQSPQQLASWLQILLRKAPTAVWWYTYNDRLNPHFWAPLLGQALAHNSQQCKQSPSPLLQNQKKLPTVLLGCAQHQLLEHELTQAFTKLGYEVIPVRTGGFYAQISPQEPSHPHIEPSKHKALLEALHTKNTLLFFSINGQGLDVHGRDFALLEALRIPVALWFVDNPWHVLAGIRLPWWKKALLMPTDASFIPYLYQEGAAKVMHMPLAVAPHMWQAQRAQQHERNTIQIQAARQAECIFVGRASFPHKKAFFAAAKVPPELLNLAQQHIHIGDNTPHYHWWAQHMRIPSFWQHSALRSLGLGAEESAQYQRSHWLRTMQDKNIAIYGDSAAWQKLLPSAPAHIFYDEVDYYGQLKTLYEAAPAVLNVTSLLLPAGLTQRHFDVWAAGGFLWTNATSGLNIFPQELVQPIAFTKPEDVYKAMHTLSHSAKQDLKQGWQEHLQNKHSYETRLHSLLEKL